MEQENAKEKVVSSRFEFEYPSPAGLVKGFKQPIGQHLLIKAYGYGTIAKLAQEQDRAIHWHINQVIAVGETGKVDIGDFIEFEQAARHINTDSFNEFSVLNTINRIKSKEPLWTVNHGYASRDAAKHMLESKAKEVEPDGNKNIITASNQITRVVEYYYIKDYQIIAKTSETPYIEDEIRALLEIKYEKKRTPNLHM